MKRDMDLIREILVRVENRSQPIGQIWQLSVSGYSDAVVQRHMDLLVQAGLLEEDKEVSTRDATRQYPIRGLTWDGHEFLDAARNGDVWSRMKEAAQEKSLSLTLEVAQQMLKALAEKKLGLNE